jgi:hypothetical protein
MEPRCALSSAFIVVSLIAMGGAALMVIDLRAGAVRKGRSRDWRWQVLETSIVCIVDDDDDVRMSLLESFLRSNRTSVLTFASAESFLDFGGGRARLPDRSAYARHGRHGVAGRIGGAWSALSGDRDDGLSDFEVKRESLVLWRGGLFCKAGGSRNAARAGGSASDKRRKIASVRRIGRVETVGVSHGTVWNLANP